MKKLSLNSTVSRLRKTENLGEIMDVMKIFFEDLGFSGWVYSCQMLRSYVTAPVFVFMNTDEKWIERYLEMGYHEVDPVARYYFNDNLPWIWNTKDDGSAMGDNAVEFMKDLQSHGYFGGLCIPLFSAQNTRGFINLASSNPSLEDLHEAHEGRAAQVVFILRYVHEEIFRVAMKTEENIYQNPLSARQKEILLWIGEGLTAKAIAEKLGIFYRTVESYLEEIQKKLCVTNRQQAVTRAFSLGYVLPLNIYQAPKDQAVKLVLPYHHG
jgi:DNA-binding CsgD family transcriptional regulator